jgi:hypothetical protein
MHRQLLIFLLFSAATFAQSVTPGSLEMTDVSHESARVLFSTGGSWDRARVRIVTGTSGCESGVAGSIYVNGYDTNANNFPGGVSEITRGKYSIPFQLLNPSTTYDICPEISNGGASWFGGQGISFTTDALPNPHPQPPTPVARFNTNYPDTTGFNFVTANSNDDCTSVRNAIKTAIGLQRTQGTVITVPAGSVCTGSLYLSQVPPDAVKLANTAFNTATSQITLPNTPASYGLNEGQAVQWTSNTQTSFPFQGSNMPGFDAPSQTPSHAIEIGEVSYVHLVGGNNIQIYARAPFGTACPNATHANQQQCPMLWQFDNQGSGDIMFAKWPRALFPIIVQSSAVTNGTFLPEHVRVNPNWAPKMARFQAPNSFLGGFSTAHCLFSTRWDTNGETGALWFTANIRLVGIELTYQPYPQANYSSDPDPGENLVTTGPDSSGIILDRCWIHGYPPPFRAYRVFDWQGKNQAFVDSYINDLHFGRQANIGLGIH